MNVLKALWEWLVWFRYKSPVRNFGSDRLDDLRQGYRDVAWGDPLLWGFYTKCFLLAVVVELIDWLNSFVKLRS
jgi:hypothetical protein